MSRCIDRLGRPLVALVLALLLGACAGPREFAPREIFDEHSGNTVSVVARPLIFARSRSDVAAYARDYATLVAVEVDHSGSTEHYLLVHRWSTVDARMAPPPPADAGRLQLIGEGRVLTLTPLPELPVGLEHRPDLHLPPHGEVVSYAYRVDAEMLRFIVKASRMTLELPQETYTAAFTVWEDGRPAWVEFLRRTGLAG
jgi:hypothetical protein